MGISLLTRSIEVGCVSLFLISNNIFIADSLLKLKKKDDSSQYLKHSAMVKDNRLLFKVSDLIRDIINSFTQTEGIFLFRIARGKAASAETVQFLLNFMKCHGGKRLKLISGCIGRSEFGEG